MTVTLNSSSYVAPITITTKVFQLPESWFGIDRNRAVSFAGLTGREVMRLIDTAIKIEQERPDQTLGNGNQFSGPGPMNTLEELEQIETEVAALGRQIEERRVRALAILKGKVGRVRGNRFRIESAKVYIGGTTTRISFEGSRLKQNGECWAAARESAPLARIDFIGDFEP